MTFDLAALGFGPFFQAQLGRWADRSLIPARIAAEHRGRYQVWTAQGSAPARLSGHLRRQLGDDAFPGVGDWVVLDPVRRAGETVLIEGVLDRRSAFRRGAAGREARPQIVAANVDRVLVVCALDAVLNLHRIERYLARVWASGAEPLIVLSKADLAVDIAGAVAELEARFPLVPILVTSALRADGAIGAIGAIGATGAAGAAGAAVSSGPDREVRLAQLRAEITEGCTAALVGSSGAGKSTLVNAMLGEERMPTGAVQAGTGRGRHVTTRRELVLLPGGGLLLDTPGMRELQLLDQEGLAAVFDDIEALSAGCRFRDCAHESEPGCVVRQAVASGTLDPDRLDHYHTLQREARAYERRHDARLRRQDERVWGQLHDEVARLNRWKGGK